MKKLTALLAAAVCAALVLLAGCSNGEFRQQSYSADAAGIAGITIEATDRQLDISRSEDDFIHIDYYDSDEEYLDISLSEDGMLTVRLAFDKDWTDFIGVKPSAEYRKIEVRVPDGTLTSLSAATTNENITVTELSFGGSVNLSSNGGSVICGRLNAGNSISLTAKNGDIEGTVVGGWNDFGISCTIKKGDCNLPEYKKGGSKWLYADCNNGNINIEFVN